jgi:hypothetical protein
MSRKGHRKALAAAIESPVEGAQRGKGDAKSNERQDLQSLLKHFRGNVTPVWITHGKATAAAWFSFPSPLDQQFAMLKVRGSLSQPSLSDGVSV